jgi:hypothetical protein
MSEIKIEVTAQNENIIVEKFGLNPFECECVLVHTEDVYPISAGDNVHVPFRIVGHQSSHRFYLVVRPKAG